MRSLALALLLAPALLGASPAHALNLCARIDQATGEPRDGASIKLRVQCRSGETAIGSMEEFARLRADVDANSEAIDAALGAGGPARIAASRPATTASASSGCGLTVTAGNAVFNACNVHVQSGEGATWGTGTFDNGTVNGLGNLIVGYNEDASDDKSGSHNLIVGPYHSYPSYGGFIAGINNTASGLYSSVSGGRDNTASGTYSSVSGGFVNTASGAASSVSGGALNEADGLRSSVSGGSSNIATTEYATVSGGTDNTASGFASTVSGGGSNIASNDGSSVLGGTSNIASGGVSSVLGGSENTANGLASSVSGGQNNTASANYSIAP